MGVRAFISWPYEAIPRGFVGWWRPYCRWQENSRWVIQRSVRRRLPTTTIMPTPSPVPTYLTPFPSAAIVRDHNPRFSPESDEIAPKCRPLFELDTRNGWIARHRVSLNRRYRSALFVRDSLRLLSIFDCKEMDDGCGKNSLDQKLTNFTSDRWKDTCIETMKVSCKTLGYSFFSALLFGFKTKNLQYANAFYLIRMHYSE